MRGVGGRGRLPGRYLSERAANRTADHTASGCLALDAGRSSSRGSPKKRGDLHAV
jgi:hypothetical protein